ncbi:hypothetical protein [Haemophilus pittmaniae]|uniref:hypothetical protein n=1 Tax=Haemophilus pittmaniae TaxID=249188 RepID=UPI0003085B49|nr:hypothetical protein [Haemophilus pittmaniae]
MITIALDLILDAYQPNSPIFGISYNNNQAQIFYDLDHKTTYRAKLAIVTVMLQL